MSVTPTELDRQLAAIKKAWFAAAEGSPERDQLHQQGQTLRSQGASEAVANILTTGSAEGAGLAYSQQYMGAGYNPESDLAARLQAAGLGGTATAPKTVDLSGLASAIGGLANRQVSLPQYQQQTPQQVDLSKLYAAGQTQPVQWSYNPPSTAGLKTAIQGMSPVTTPQAQTPQTFTAQQLQGAINAPQPQAPQAMAPQMSAEQIWQRVGETSQYMQPYVEAQTKAVTTAFNKAMQQVRNQQALRGMQAGGGAMAQQRGMIGDLGTQVGNIQANALMQSLNTAIQIGQLSQAEAEAIWNQQMQGVSFTQAQQIARAQLLQNALGQQESQRLAEQGLGLNVQQLQQAREQAQLGLQADVLGLETQQAQFGSQLGLQGQQLEIQRQQQLADNLARALGMDIGQKQWGQEFTAQQMRDIFNQAATAEQLSQAQRQSALNALTDLTQLDIGQSQWSQQFALTEQEQASKLQAAREKQQWDQTMDAWQTELKMNEAEFDRWLKTETLTLDKAKHKTEKDYKAYLEGKGLSEQQGQVVTNAWLADLLGASGPEEAFKLLTSQAEEIANSGANVSLILSSLRNRWPDFYSNSSGGYISIDQLRQAWGATPDQ